MACSSKVKNMNNVISKVRDSRVTGSNICYESPEKTIKSKFASHSYFTPRMRESMIKYNVALGFTEGLNNTTFEISLEISYIQHIMTHWPLDNRVRILKTPPFQPQPASIVEKMQSFAPATSPSIIGTLFGGRYVDLSSFPEVLEPEIKFSDFDALAQNIIFGLKVGRYTRLLLGAEP